MRESSLSRRVMVVESILEEPPSRAISVVPARSTAVRRTDPLPVLRRPSRLKKFLVNGALVIVFGITFLGFIAWTQRPVGPVGVITGWDGGVMQNVVVVTQNSPKATPVVTTKQVKMPVAAPAKAANASQALVRIDQTNAANYSSTDQYNNWWPSDCSASSMKEVMDAYGKKLSLTDVINYESSIHEITTDQGLMEWQGIDYTTSHFGFKTQEMNNPTIDDVVNAGNNGTPVIIGFPPYKWTGGHILVVIGGKTISGIQYVHLADSSRLNMQWMTYATFEKYWGGQGDIVTPA